MSRPIPLGLLGLVLGGGPWTLACADSTREPATEPRPQGVFVDASVTYQTLEGFGASVAWYQGALVNHPLKDEIYEHIFAELGLDILRFRNRYQRTDADDRDLSPEVEIIQRATDSLGRAPKVLLTSWSPPGAVKASGAEHCDSNDPTDTCTLRRVDGEFAYGEFAAYWYDSLHHYAEQGIVPDYVSIQNEPDFHPPGWEGCQFQPAETDNLPGYDRALAEVHARVSELSSPPALLGPETLGIHYNKVAEYLGPLDTTLLGGIAHHLYETGGDGVPDWRQPGPDSYLAQMRSTGNLVSDLSLFQTEFSTAEDSFIEGGLETAWLIHSSMAEEGTAAFLYWDLVWGYGGLVSLQGEEYTIRDQYYSVRHFARFTDPGWLRVDASSSLRDLKVSAYVSPERDQLTVVLVNTASAEVSLPLDLGGADLTSAELYRTIFDPGASQTWEQLDGLPEDGSLAMPSRSVITLVARL